MQDDVNTIDMAEESTGSSVDIKSLLDAANSTSFDESESLLRGKDTFEKADSFFDLIKSDAKPDDNVISEREVPLSESDNQDNSDQIKLDAGSDNNVISESEVLRSESDDIDKLNEKLSEDLNQKSLEDGPSKDITFISLEEKDTDFELQVKEDSNISGGEENENLDPSEMAVSNEDSDTSFEAVNVVKEVLNLNGDEVNDDNNKEITLEESEDYQRGYQEALVEFENTLQVEKKAVADFAKTLFSVRDDLAKLIEELLIEKTKQICTRFLGDQIDETPELLLQRISEVSSEIIEKTGEVIVELNEIDATAFNEKSSDLPFTIKTTTDLGRGEFRIISGKSGYHQTISN